MKRSAVEITVHHASLQYQGELLFDKLSLRLYPQKWTVLLGPSGVGKTSLLRLIAGLTTDAQLLQPITVSDHLPLQQSLAYMPQQDLLLPWFSVLDNVLLGAKLRGEKSTALIAEAKALLQRLGLASALNKKPAELSGGMRQRVALARTFMENRPVILMDEPFSAVDVVTRLELQELAAELLIDRTVLLITHDPLEALRLGDIIYVMTGKPAQLGEAIYPQGEKPRALTDSNILQLQGELLYRLEQAKRAMPW